MRVATNKNNKHFDNDNGLDSILHDKVANGFTIEIVTPKASGESSDQEEEIKETTDGDSVVGCGHRGNNMSDTKKVLEVHYSNATPLFRDIEDCEWDRALGRVQQELESANPVQSQIWVKSNENDPMALSWNKWSRLPLHEACRRQPPVAFIDALLTAYPESIHATTNFAETALHLACKGGADDRVINLLIAANPAVVRSKDYAGRTPLDVVMDYTVSCKSVVPRSLKRCEDYLVQTELAEEARLYKQQTQHSEEALRLEGFSRVSEEEAQESLQLAKEELTGCKKEIKDLKQKLAVFDLERKFKLEDEKNVQQLISVLKAQLYHAKRANVDFEANISSLKEQVASRDSEIKLQKLKNNGLLKALECTAAQHAQLQKQLIQVVYNNDEYRKAVE